MVWTALTRIVSKVAARTLPHCRRRRQRSRRISSTGCIHRRRRHLVPPPDAGCPHSSLRLLIAFHSGPPSSFHSLTFILQQQGSLVRILDGNLDISNFPCFSAPRSGSWRHHPFTWWHGPRTRVRHAYLASADSTTNSSSTAHAVS